MQLRVQYSGPAEAKGAYQSLRSIVNPILMAIFLILPWIKLNGEQFLLIDFFNRKFIIFGVPFYSHDAPLLFFLIMSVLLTIFILTAVLGRIWCGWVCPQTVFLGGVFNVVERMVLGGFARRQIFWRSEGSVVKLLRVVALYASFALISWVMSHSFAAYFIGSGRVLEAIQTGPSKNLVTFSILMIFTGAVFVNFSFFREKLCIFICPYGRFQNALLDGNSVVVSYDKKRGDEQNHCVKCERCINVCPTSVDIRKGFQLDCIACGRCVDACDEVMAKVGNPKRLIQYETGDRKRVNLFRFRILLYSVLFVFVVGSLIYRIWNRQDFNFSWTRSHTQPFSIRTELGKKIIQNQILIHISNQAQQERLLKISLDEESINQGFKLFSPASELLLKPGQDLKTLAFLEIEESRLLPQGSGVTLNIEDFDTTTRKQGNNQRLRQVIPFIRTR